MNAPATFLTELAHALAASSLYAAGHPARGRAIEAAFRSLVSLRSHVPRPIFTFLGDEVVCGSRPVRELRGWDWGVRLADAGIQRLEFEPDVALDEFTVFTEDVVGRLNLVMQSVEAPAPTGGRIRFGSVGIRGESATAETPTATLSCALGAEAATVRWLQDEVRSDRVLRLFEAEAVVSSLSVALNDDQTMLPLLRLAGYDQFTTYHALNVTSLTLAFGQRLGLARTEIRALGVAALLHDMGKMKIPVEILNKSSRLTEEEFRIVQRHPGDGARLILRSGRAPDIAAVVAHEHHINYDGTGYPTFGYPRKCHYASRLVHLCDVYDALRSARPYRDAWPAERVLGYVDARAGSEFDPELAPVFTAMMRGLEEGAAVLDEPQPAASSDPAQALVSV